MGIEETGKYVATVMPVGKDVWDVSLEEVKYDPDTNKEVSRSSINTARFTGTEAECRDKVIKAMRRLIADRDAVIAASPFIITEADLAPA